MGFLPAFFVLDVCVVRSAFDVPPFAIRRIFFILLVVSITLPGTGSFLTPGRFLACGPPFGFHRWPPPLSGNGPPPLFFFLDPHDEKNSQRQARSDLPPRQSFAHHRAASPVCLNSAFPPHCAPSDGMFLISSFFEVSPPAAGCRVVSRRHWDRRSSVLTYLELFPFFFPGPHPRRDQPFFRNDAPLCGFPPLFFFGPGLFWLFLWFAFFSEPAAFVDGRR